MNEVSNVANGVLGGCETFFAIVVCLFVVLFVVVSLKEWNKHRF